MAESEAELVEQLLIIGNRLASPPTDPQQLLSLLDESERFLSKVEQSPCQSILTALHPAMMALVDEKLLKQSEVDLKVAVASCITEMTRITAPYAPYDDYIMKDFFQMIVNAFEKLNDISSPSYSKRISILETVSKIRSCVIMVDLECDALVLEMFRNFLKTIRPSHPKKVFSLMEDIMTLVLEESEGISSELLSCLLLSVKEDNKDVSPIAHKLAEKVINNCALKLKPYLVEAISTGTYLTDYGSIVASLCQENSNALIYEAQIHEKELDQKLVGSWIEVWWPDDNRFYPGVIDAYYPHTKKHKILYTDGDTEVLMLKDEYWKLVDSREADREQATDIQSPNASLEKRVEDSGPKTNSELDSKIIRKATTRTVKIAEWMEGNIAINLPQKRPYAEIETETKRSDPTTAEGTNEDLKAKALEVSMRSSLEKESAAKEKKITGKMSPSNSSAALHDLSPSPAPTESGQVRDSRESIINTSVNVSNITRIPARATDICLAEDKHSMEIVAVKKNLVNDEEIEDLKVIEAEKRLQREKRRSLVSSPLIPKASLCDEGHVDLSENIFDSASMEKIRIFSRIIQNKWYQIKLEPLPNYAELADEFGRNAASEHGHLFKTIRQSPHYGGVDASDPKALENLWYTLPLVLEGLHKSFESQRYLQRNIETMRGWFTKLAQAGFDISVPLAAFHLLTVSPTDFKNFRESLKSVSLQLDEEKQNVEDLKSKLPVSKRVAGLDSKIKDLKQQLRDLESERMSLERLEGVELELEKYGTSLKACRLEKLKELYEHKIAEAKQFLRDVSLDGWFERTELASSTQ